MSTITDLGATTSVDVIARHLRLEGLRGVDVGCGDMTFTRSLAERGARMLAVDPDAIQAEKNRANGPIGNIEFREADAEALPVEDAALDAVFFSFSLHHVPTSIHAAVFDEAARVLRPDGALCVIEPADCPLNTVMKHFHDETDVRNEAQQSLHELAVPRFDTHAMYRYHSFIEFDDFEDFATRYGSRSFNPDYTEADVRTPAVEASFEAHGAATGYRFQSPKVMMLLRGARGRSIES